MKCVNILKKIFFSVLGIEPRTFILSYIPSPLFIFLRQCLANLLTLPRLPPWTSPSGGITSMAPRPSSSLLKHRCRYRSEILSSIHHTCFSIMFLQTPSPTLVDSGNLSCFYLPGFWQDLTVLWFFSKNNGNSIVLQDAHLNFSSFAQILQIFASPGIGGLKTSRHHSRGSGMRCGKSANEYPLKVSPLTLILVSLVLKKDD